MSIDHGMIDEDHKALIGLVNALDEAQPGPALHTEIMVILNQLNAYVKVHFQREEELQHANGYINADAHARYHASALRDLHATRIECENNMDMHQLIAFQQRLSKLLDEWLMDHITRSDALMKPLLAEMRTYAQKWIPLGDVVRSGDSETARDAK